MDHLSKAIEHYEALERLRHDEDFNIFKKLVDDRLANLDIKIHEATDDSVLVDIQVHKELTKMYTDWFVTAENEAKRMRTLIKEREDK